METKDHAEMATGVRPANGGTPIIGRSGSVNGLELKGKPMIQVGEKVLYYGKVNAIICEGIVAEHANGPLTGNPRFRIVDLASEVDDLEAGTWRDLEDIIGFRTWPSEF